MDYVVNAVEMRRADENTISFFGVPQLVLMERAALSAKDFCEQKWPELFAGSARILIVAGNGNNGGDGAALARLFYLQGHSVTLLVSGKEEKYSDALKSQIKILEKYKAAGDKRKTAESRQTLRMIDDDGWQMLKEQNTEKYDLVADALFGVGFSKRPEGIYSEKIDWMNRLSGKKAALDMPSGVLAQDGSVSGSCFFADLTVTFGFVKTGMLLYPGKTFCGEIKIAEIGITEESFLDSPPRGLTLDRTKKTWQKRRDVFPKRRDNSNKGSYGKVLLFAGSAQMPGAALLAGEAVLRSGAGMLQLVSAPENRELVLSKLPEAMYREAAESTEWEKLLSWCDMAVVGPGISQEQQACKNLEKILTLLSEEGLHKPVLLDADALNLTALSERLFQIIKNYTSSGGIVVMTPHMAEFARLLHCDMDELLENRMEKIESYVRESGVILAAKDAATIVSYVDEAEDFHYYINQTGNNGMATAGSGDVLSGIAGALAAFCAAGQRDREKKLSVREIIPAKTAFFETVCQAVYLHGLAGDAAAEEYGKTSMKAGDMIAALPRVFSKDGMKEQGSQQNARFQEGVEQYEKYTGRA